MKKVITYGTYDLLHYGHIRLLERAKALGDYLIVGVTSEDFDRKRGKINVEQSLMERIQAVKKTGLADEIIIEEYEGQKIDDIINYGIDVFTVGSDWEGKFDYLKEYCEVVYLPRTKGISSTEIRSTQKMIKLGAIGYANLVNKYFNEVNYVNGMELTGICTDENKKRDYVKNSSLVFYDDLSSMLENVDAVYIGSNTSKHYDQIKEAIQKKKSVLYEPPMTLSVKEASELQELAKNQNVILMEAMKTKYAQSYNRLVLLAKSGVIGDIVSVDATCTSLSQIEKNGEDEIINNQNSICAWGPTALLPIFELLGIDYIKKEIITKTSELNDSFDLFTIVNFVYDNAVASAKIGKGVKSESDLVISGTKGYIYVPSPWWKTDYFEIRYEDREKTQRYFYPLEGEGIRYELVKFNRAIRNEKLYSNCDISLKSISIIEDFYNKKDVCQINKTYKLEKQN